MTQLLLAAPPDPAPWISAGAQETLVKASYLVAATLFILGIKGLSHPRTAVRANLMGALGMLLAIVVTLLDRQIVSYTWIIAGLATGGAIGLPLAMFVKMTAMPQMVALLNGFGGLASVLVAGAAKSLDPAALDGPTLVFTGLAGLIGGVTFTGSLVAYGKLQEYKWVPDGRLFPGHAAVNFVLLLACTGLIAALVFSPENFWVYWVIAVLSGALGLMLVIPVGGADAPVVIALLNSYSGLAAATTGFVLDNTELIIAGALVGASGVILTHIMCKAMNRSLMNVLVGGGTAGGKGPKQDEVYAGKVKSTTPEELAMLLDAAQSVMIVPGYGLAVSQAQHAVRDLTNILTERGVTVEFAIHPVAGRMPGHMNVLLAEADIPYERVKDMDQSNLTIAQVDVAIVLGANDVVNPLARTDPKSPIAGMPIIDVDKARTVVVIKRSLSPGFAGIPNPLFAADNALMLFADGKQAVLDTIVAMRAL